MTLQKRILKIGAFLILFLSLLLSLSMAKEVKKDKVEKDKGGKEFHILDEYNRVTPRSTLEGFFSFAAKGDFKEAAKYLDLKHLPARIKKYPGPELARKLKIILDRSIWIDLSTISDDPKGDLNDGLPPYKERVGRIKTPKGSVDIILRRVPSGDGVRIWKFSSRTLSKIPFLYKYYGYRPLEEKLGKIFPDFQFMGWQLWQWCAYLLFIIICYIIAWVLTHLFALFIKERHDDDFFFALKRFIKGPLKIVLWLSLGRAIVYYLKPSQEIQRLMNAGTLLVIAVCWASIRAVDLLFDIWIRHLSSAGRQSTTILFKPFKTLVKVFLVIMALLLWLDNIGYDVGTLLAGLGVGGLAVALAAQGVLRNLIGTVMILADRPYQVGERIVVNGHDGVVEEIGLRSTKLRLLTGHQTSIPNDKVERAEIENIERRPFIRRKETLYLSLDTPIEKVERAVEIIREILNNYEGYHKEYPPRVFFDRFNRDSLGIVFYYWYQPPEYWKFLEFSQSVNVKILKAFEKEGIRLALPQNKTFLEGARGEREPILIKAL